MSWSTLSEADMNDLPWVVNHMSHLETLTEAQAERIGTLTELVERLQRENTSLKQARWSSSFAEFNGYDRSAGSRPTARSSIAPRANRVVSSGKALLRIGVAAGPRRAGHLARQMSDQPSPEQHLTIRRGHVLDD
jgi:hypothetical protein